MGRTGCRCQFCAESQEAAPWGQGCVALNETCRAQGKQVVLLILGEGFVYPVNVLHSNSIISDKRATFYSGWRLDTTLLPGVTLSCSVRHGLSLLPSSAGFFRPRTLQQLFWLMQSQEDTRWKDAEALATTWIREVKRKEVSASNTKDEVWKGRVKVIALIEPIGFL